MSLLENWIILEIIICLVTNIDADVEECSSLDILKIRQLNTFDFNGTNHKTRSLVKVDNLMECLSLCIQDENCDKAVVCDLKNQSRLCSTVKGNITDSLSSQFTACVTADKVGCENGGSYFDGMCHCADGFTGMKCIQQTDDYCHTIEWSNLYSTRGGVVTGDLSALIESINKGYKIKVSFGNQNRILSLIESYGIVRNAPWGHSIRRLQVNLLNKSDESAFRVIQSLTTTNVSTWTYSIDTLSEAQRSIGAEMDWFATPFSEETSCKQTVSSDSLQGCWENVNRSSDIRISKGIVESIQLEQDNFIYIHVSPSGSQASSRMLIVPLYWFSVNYDSNGNAHILRWFVKSHNLKSTGSGKPNIPWFLDSCWHEAYQNAPSGSVISGSKSYLMAAVRNGKDVRILTLNVSSHLRHIYISNGSVSGVMYDTSNTDSSNQGLRVRTSVSTSGLIEICTFLWESSLNQSFSSRAGNIRWFVESRKWVKKLSMTSSGSVINGIKEDFLADVNRGKTVKMVMTHMDDSIQAASINHIHFLNATFVVLDTGILGAVDKKTRTCQQWSGYLYLDGVYQTVVISTGSATIKPRSTISYKTVDLFVQM